MKDVYGQAESQRDREKLPALHPEQRPLGRDPDVLILVTITSQLQDDRGRKRNADGEQCPDPGKEPHGGR